MKRTILAAALFTALSTTAIAQDNDWKDDTKDAWIDGKAEATLLFNTKLNSFDIDTDVEAGKVTLTGKVENIIEKELAEELVRGIDGVTDVDNSLTLFSDDMDEMESEADTAMSAMKNKSHSAVDKDSSAMENKSKTAMNDHPHDMDEKSKAATHNQMNDMDEKSQTAMNDRMDDMDTKSSKSMNEMSDNMDDAEESTLITDATISSVVKSRLLFDSEVSGTAINVDVENRVVTLKGSVKSEAERDLVVSIAEDTDDVDSVNDELTIDPETE